MNAPPASTPAPAAADNPITLRVMRFCRPSFSFGLPLPLAGSPADPEGDPGTVDSLSGMLALPQSFGDIYLGETFTCHISLCNTSPMALAKVGLKVEVQTQLQRETLPSSDGADAPWHRAWHRASAAGGPSSGGSLPRRALSWPPLRSPAAGAPRP